MQKQIERINCITKTDHQFGSPTHTFCQNGCIKPDLLNGYKKFKHEASMRADYYSILWNDDKTFEEAITQYIDA